jgi:hypothetical protein
VLGKRQQFANSQKRYHGGCAREQKNRGTQNKEKNEGNEYYGGCDTLHDYL